MDHPKHRVLVVDDDPQVRESFKDVLELDGYAVLTAAGGDAALAVLYDTGPPCVLLLDLHMPAVDGWTVLARLAQYPPEVQPLHVVVVSGIGDMGSLERRYGCTVMSKPVDLDALLAVVERHCSPWPAGTRAPGFDASFAGMS